MVNMGEISVRILNTQMDRVPINETERKSSLLRPGDLLFARQSLVLEGAGSAASSWVTRRR